jgi:hypothetical protein
LRPLLLQRDTERLPGAAAWCRGVTESGRSRRLAGTSTVSEDEAESTPDAARDALGLAVHAPGVEVDEG